MNDHWPAGAMIPEYGFHMCYHHPPGPLAATLLAELCRALKEKRYVASDGIFYETYLVNYDWSQMIIAYLRLYRASDLYHADLI